MADGRLVSANWGGARKRPKRYETKEAAKAGGKEKKQQRAAEKNTVRERFIKHRDATEKVSKWQGPRRFEAWLLALAERELAAREPAEATVMPEVSAAQCRH